MKDGKCPMGCGEKHGEEDDIISAEHFIKADKRLRRLTKTARTILFGMVGFSVGAFLGWHLGIGLTLLIGVILYVGVELYFKVRK